MEWAQRGVTAPPRRHRRNINHEERDSETRREHDQAYRQPPLAEPTPRRPNAQRSNQDRQHGALRSRARRPEQQQPDIVPPVAPGEPRTPRDRDQQRPAENHAEEKRRADKQPPHEQAEEHRLVVIAGKGHLAHHDRQQRRDHAAPRTPRHRAAQHKRLRHQHRSERNVQQPQHHRRQLNARRPRGRRRVHHHEVVILQRRAREARVIQRPVVFDDRRPAHEVNPVVKDRPLRQSVHQRRFRKHLPRRHHRRAEKRRTQAGKHARMMSREPHVHRPFAASQPDRDRQTQPPQRHPGVGEFRVERRQPQVRKDLQRESRRQSEGKRIRNRERPAIQEIHRHHARQGHVERKVPEVIRQRIELVAARPRHDERPEPEQHQSDTPKRRGFKPRGGLTNDDPLEGRHGVQGGEGSSAARRLAARFEGEVSQRPRPNRDEQRTALP